MSDVNRLLCCLKEEGLYDWISTQRFLSRRQLTMKHILTLHTRRTAFYRDAVIFMLPCITFHVIKTTLNTLFFLSPHLKNNICPVRLLWASYGITTGYRFCQKKCKDSFIKTINYWWHFYWNKFVCLLKYTQLFIYCTLCLGIN